MVHSSLWRKARRAIWVSGTIHCAVSTLLNQGNLLLFYLSYGAMALLGAGTVPVTWTTAITQVFSRQRALRQGSS